MTGKLFIGGVEPDSLGEIDRLYAGDELMWPPAVGGVQYVVVNSTASFVVPAGVSRLGICMVGSGGNGQNRTTAQGLVGPAGAGGGLAWASFDVSPGDQFDFVLGAQGTLTSVSSAPTGVLMRVVPGGNGGGGVSNAGGAGTTGIIVAPAFFANRNGVTGVGTGGNGGGGGSSNNTPPPGGGGAGGYTGDGGAGGSGGVINGGPGTGGGGGGGGVSTASNSPRRGARGGSTVVFGQAGSGGGGAGGNPPVDGEFGSIDGVPALEVVVLGGSGGPGGFNQTVGLNGFPGAIAIRLNGPDYPEYAVALVANTTFIP